MMNSDTLKNLDLLCFSHLRWDFVYQRPQHLMARFARNQRVFFVEEPIFDAQFPRMQAVEKARNLWQVQPHLSPELMSETDTTLRSLLAEFIQKQRIAEYVSWYYTPMALGFTDGLTPQLIVYDCMDELSAFRGAPALLVERESELLECADLVFTGGQSLYQAKAKRHPKVYAFPSAVDRDHFAQARTGLEIPEQESIPSPRLGFFGVIDERLDIELLAGVARARPDWQIIMVGPVVKIDPASLPRQPNIHYLGSKSYAELPFYLGGWDVALLPFARNEATRFISPTKTPEYLAGGKPVVSTFIRDVVQPYGVLNLVEIADTVPDFVAAVERALSLKKNDSTWLERVDTFLEGMSWDATWQQMTARMEQALDIQTVTGTKSNLEQLPDGEQVYV